MKNGRKLLTAFLIGAAAGAVLGILFAPGKEPETRRKMNEEGKKMSDAMKNKFKEKMNTVKDDLEEPLGFA